MNRKIKNDLEAKINVCKVCGSSFLFLEKHIWKNNNKKITIHIKCSNCYHSGPDVIMNNVEKFNMFESRAIHLWNKENEGEYHG